MKVKISTGKDGSKEYVSQKSVYFCKGVEKAMNDYIARNQEAIERAVLDLAIYGASEFELSEDQLFKDE